MTATARFWDKVRKTRKGCWLFNGATNHSGHGRFWDGTRLVQAHRFSYSIANGNIPEGLQVLHTCDVPNCVNPDHLWLGTNYDNVQDKVSKGRQQKLKGSQHGRAKLNEADIFAIRERYAEGDGSYRSLGREYGISHTMIRYIVKGDNWSHA